ncbi:heavy metal translocating P-type ATPase [Salinigranum rubrum]|uniref:Heavy metal translocating P-type ATPase n=1 Tax=Salinigranum rubrum TaxID=755307 RepID=A0A2I8VGS6_9EURY|nr:cation-translocating P-type ATPase [Salinigranum rubrum]AUV81121.1 heavy metal translocating P-type ATPase [Salinigranum rubrum]
MTDRCTLCDLPTPDPPVTGPDVDGAFCCQGCLVVARTLDDAAAADLAPEEVDTAIDDADGAGGDERTPSDAVESYLAVDGMHCATCEAFVESRLRGGGVYDADASYASGLVKVTHEPGADTDDLVERIDGLGYRARNVDDERERDSSDQVGRLLVGGFFGMMTMLWYVLFLYPTYLGVDASLLLFDVSSPAGAYLVANVWVMATIVLVYTGFPILRGAYVSLRAASPNMDLLVATAATTAYVYSTLLALTGANELYFDITVVVVLAVSIGGYYEERLREAAAGSLADLSERRVSEARVRTATGTETVSLDGIGEGDEVVVRAGETVPVDGVVSEGSGAVDESLVTGESRPVRREVGDSVLGGSRLREGGLVVAADAEATRTLDRLVELQWSLRTRSGAQRLADRLAGVFVPLVFALAVVAAGAHLALGATPTNALLTGLTVLVVSCPCALGLATPMAVAGGVREALSRGVVVRSGELFERADETETVAFDKTGTLTTGRMAVHAVEGDDGTLAVAAALERFADHPVADAIVARAERDGRANRAEPPSEQQAATPDGGRGTVTDVETHPGRGVSGTVGGREALVGSADLFAARGWGVPEELGRRATETREAGAVPALVGWDGDARGLVVAGDEPRPEWEAVVDALSRDHRVVVVTGDGEAATAPFAAHDGVSEVFADTRPEAKVALVERLRDEGGVVFVGDGSNDAPALAAADLGIALESGTPLAVDAADAVVTTDDLRTVETVFDVTRATRRRIRENLGWAFLYNVVAVPLAAVGLLNPLFAAVAMATSSLVVVVNSRRAYDSTEETGGEPA